MALTTPTNDLTGNTIASTYDQILFIDGAALTNSALFAVACQDGETALHVANDQILIKDSSGTDIASCFEVQDKDGTVCLSVNGTNNRVGIGTASPDDIFHIIYSDATAQGTLDENDSGAGIQIENTNASGCASIHLKCSDADGWISYNDTGTNAGNFLFETDDNALMTILSAGNVGIGTTTPACDLNIDCANIGGNDADEEVAIQLESRSSGSNDETVRMYWHKTGTGTDHTTTGFRIGRKVDNTHYGQIHLGNGEATSATNPFFGILENEIFRLVVDGSGKVGIGTATPDQIFHIKHDTTSVIGLAEIGTATSGEYAAFKAKATGNSDTAEAEIGVVYYDKSGAGGSNASVAYLKLEEGNNGTDYIWMDNNSNMMGSQTAGDRGGTGGTIISASAISDERVKNISSDVFPYGLDEVNALKPIKFKWAYTGGDTSDILGFGAKATKSIIPEVVYDSGQPINKLDKDGNYIWEYSGDDKSSRLAMHREQIVPILVKAIQELSAKVTALESA